MPARFSITHRVQFAETDLAGIVHFANFFRMMEEVEHAFFRARGLSVMMHHEGAEMGWPRVSVACEYSGSARFEDELTLNFRVIRLGDKSMTYEVDFLLEDKRIATGKVTTVCCLLESGGMKSIPIPASIRAKLESP